MKPTLGAYSFPCMRLVLAVIFLVAGAGKIANPEGFAKIISNYRLLPDNMASIVAVVLPWLETLLGLLILCGWWLPGAVVLADLLLLVFFAALAQAAARGIDLHCGCFSTKVAGSPHTLLYFARDLLFLLLGAAVLHRLFRKLPSKEDTNAGLRLTGRQ